MAAIEGQRRALEAKQRILENVLAQSRHLAAWLEGDGEATEGGRRWRVRVCPEEYFIDPEDENAKGIFEKDSEKTCFVEVTDDWYDPIRELSA